MQVRVETFHGIMERAIGLPGGQITLAALARAVLPLASDLEAAAVRRAAASDAAGPAVCAKGCGACCRQLVTVSPAEAWMVEGLLETLPGLERAAVGERFRNAEETLARAGLAERLLRLDDPALDAAAHYALAEKYFRLGLACPFLDAGGACGHYDRRPALCREYLVRSPAADCADPFARPPERLTLAAEVSQALLGVSAQCLRRELQPVPLTLAPLWARRHAAEGRRRWDAGRLLERFLLHLEVSIGQQAGAGSQDFHCRPHG